MLKMLTSRFLRFIGFYLRHPVPRTGASTPAARDPTLRPIFAFDFLVMPGVPAPPAFVASGRASPNTKVRPCMGGPGGLRPPVPQEVRKRRFKS